MEEHYNRTAQQGKAQLFIKIRPNYESLNENGLGSLTFELVNEATARLRSEGICYFTKDKDNIGYRKLGISKDFITRHKVVEK